MRDEPVIRRHSTAKVAVSGPFSTGKTTLVRSAAEQLTAEGIAVVVLGDVARDAPMSLHFEQTPSASAWLLGTQIARESEAMRSTPDIILCDRAIFDILSHTLLIEPNSEFDRLLLPRIWDIGASWAGTYDLVITTAVDRRIPPIADGVRVADNAYRRQLDKALDDVFKRLQLTRRDLPTGPEDALETALSQLRRLH